MQGTVKSRDYYATLRRPFLPLPCRMILIAESPPVSGKYFYDCDGAASEHLFTGMMSSLFNDWSPASKLDGLLRFQKNGLLLLDSSYVPINDIKSNSKRNTVIRDSFPTLLSELEDYSRTKKVPIILIKSNVCRVLEPLLRDQRYNVLNQGVCVPFPSHGHQSCFQGAMRMILKTSRILLK